MMRLIAAVLTAMLLIGCTDIPTAGPVQEVPLGSEPRGVQIIAKPPEPGISAVRLVENFVQAMVDPDVDYSVARKYLTKESAAQWQPGEGGAVFRGVVSEEDETVLVKGMQTGVLDGEGRFTATGNEMSHDFAVVQEEGEWRIGNPPAGVLVSDYIFERWWSHVTIYFGAASGNHVVPDLIHVPDALLTPGRIVEALVAGPSAAIESSVLNAMGPQVGLAARSASVDSEGTVLVALTGLDTAMSEDRRRLLGAQLLWSLTAIPRVTGLQVLNDGRVYPLPDQNEAAVLEVASQQRLQLLPRTATSDLFGVRDGVGVRIDGEGEALPMESQGAAVSEVAVSIDQTLVGFINESRTTVLVGPLGGALIPISPGHVNLRAAQFALGNLWLMGDDAAGVTHLIRITGAGKIIEVDTTGVGDGLVDFSVSQAGERAAVIVERAGERRLVMSSVDESTRPRLAAVAELSLLNGRNPLTNFGGVEWSGETELVVLAEAQAGTSVFRTRLDGSLVEDLGPLLERPVQVSALPGTDGTAVVMRSEEDVIVRHDANNRWTRLDDVLQDVTYPG